MRILVSLLFFVFILSLTQCATKDDEQTLDKEAYSLFNPISFQTGNQSFIVPEGSKVDILFTAERDSVRRGDGEFFPAKDKHDFIQYVPIEGSSEHGYLFVNHESKTADPNLGDGGGMTWFELRKTENGWMVEGDHHAIDFSHLGGTWHNCGGTVTPYGTILSAEEYPPFTNSQLSNKGLYYTDTTDFNGIKRNEQMGWFVEIDPNEKTAMRKLYSLGRFSHEDAQCMPDGKTLYMTDDFSPAVFFKFIADTLGDFSKGQLYAYRQSEDAEGGDWISLPMELDSLIDTRMVAIRMGATLFNRHEWIDEVGGMIYITETGLDSCDWNDYIEAGGAPAAYFNEGPFLPDSRLVDDPYGRVLKFDPTTNKMEVILRGGMMDEEKGSCFSNPDGLATVNLGGKDYLVICEDIIALDRGRVTPEALAAGEAYNEVFFLELGKDSYNRNDLIRFSAGPRGCEQTGPIFTPDAKTMFISIQSPQTDNPVPFNRSMVVAVSGIF